MLVIFGAQMFTSRDAPVSWSAVQVWRQTCVRDSIAHTLLLSRSSTAGLTAPHTEKLVWLSFGLSPVSALTAAHTENATLSAEAALVVHVGHRATGLDEATDTLASHTPELGQIAECPMTAARVTVFMSAA